MALRFAQRKHVPADDSVINSDCRHLERSPVTAETFQAAAEEEEDEGRTAAGAAAALRCFSRLRLALRTQRGVESVHELRHPRFILCVCQWGAPAPCAGLVNDFSVRLCGVFMSCSASEDRGRQRGTVRSHD